MAASSRNGRAIRWRSAASGIRPSSDLTAEQVERNYRIACGLEEGTQAQLSGRRAPRRDFNDLQSEGGGTRSWRTSPRRSNAQTKRSA